ncbi:MAG: YccF domain-containing protein [Atopobiaceae bacterium]|jgi:uncharacterized membrane protein YccF (DUF307 family)|nr:YccF domain-containing protein [Atopobiaceae bacterium]MCI2173319.1 YccF domain-containing protein [Atopobiaceae bacterium]MCI2207314.1 YccF domain-containing protein [Atopobiaceae bacterium]
MSFIGNVIWFLFAGLWQALAWAFVGALWCITVVGIPVGLQCFKMAGLSCMPFGRQVVYGGGLGSTVVNVLWIVFGGAELALAFCVNGALLCITVVGIPFGLQCFKQAKLALMPIGAAVVAA